MPGSGLRLGRLTSEGSPGQESHLTERSIRARALDRPALPRAFALLYGAGGTLVLVTLLVPTESDRFEPGMVIPALLALGVTALMLIGQERPPLWVFQSLPTFGAVLITSVAYSGGTTTFNAYALLYLWVIISGFYFFDWRLGLVGLLTSATGYALVLLHHDAADDPLLYYLMGVGTFSVAGLLLALLSERISQLLDALRGSDRLKTTIIRSVSHDFRTPLTAIIAAGESSSSPTLDSDDRRELASVIVTEATRLSTLLEKLMDLSKLEAGAAEPRPIWCSLEEIVETALERMPARERFVVATQPDLPLVRADAGQLEGALLNLFENSSRFAIAAPVEVTLEARDDSVLVRVRDHGPGISPEDREHIFEPFYRGRHDAGPYDPGLGLAITKGFVEANGGLVRAELASEGGTTFVVELPRFPEDAADPPRVSERR